MFDGKDLKVRAAAEGSPFYLAATLTELLLLLRIVRSSYSRAALRELEHIFHASYVTMIVISTSECKPRLREYLPLVKVLERQVHHDTGRERSMRYIPLSEYVRRLLPTPAYVDSLQQR